MSTPGERIRARRIQFELTVKAVADYAGVRPPTVSQWESDLMLPKGESMKRLEEILKTNSDWILYGKGNPDARYVLVQPDSQEFKAISLSTKRIPVLSWVQAGAWNDIGCDDQKTISTDGNQKKNIYLGTKSLIDDIKMEKIKEIKDKNDKGNLLQNARRSEL